MTYSTSLKATMIPVAPLAVGTTLASFAFNALGIYGDGTGGDGPLDQRVPRRVRRGRRRRPGRLRPGRPAHHRQAVIRPHRDSSWRSWRC